jgi:GntR family transcriptional repressor for pyruvate dehydrogenase complex
MEVRRILEGSIAGLAAERRTEADIERLEAVLGEARDHVEDLGAFIRSDLAFHAALAAASHNELFLLILQSLGTVLREVRELGSRIPGTPERALSHHQRILDAVRSRDPEAARAAMDIHMDEAQATLTSAVDTPRGPA